jgi:hypothetical protein
MERNMTRFLSLAILGLAVSLALVAVTHAQPHIGFVYPAGAQQGSTVSIRLGGQRLDGVQSMVVSGAGVQAELVDYHRVLNNPQFVVIRENLRELQREAKQRATRKQRPLDPTTREIMARIQQRLDLRENFPANRALANLVFVEVTVAPDAALGPREIRLVTLDGVSNPLTFHIGEVPEVAREPMRTARMPVLGNEEAAERRRPPDQAEQRVAVPCTANGQVAAGEVNSYRFKARRGQRLVIATKARQLQPYIADAVPGWFQPVLTLYDAEGREVAFNDDFRFQPDSVIYYEVPEDGEFVLTISDALFRGREDWVYRLTIAEQPFLTGIFPMGGRVSEAIAVEMLGWNLDGSQLILPPSHAPPGIHSVVAQGDLTSNRVPFALDTLPECIEREPNDDRLQAEPIELPVIINGRIQQPGDWDVFQFEGRAGQKVVAKVTARRLDSPLDSLLKLTDADGNLLALNDDYEDPGTGLNTHHADSYILVELPSAGTYFVHLGDTTHQGGDEYGYRLRISEPQPDFELRVVPPSLGITSKGTRGISVYAIRRDGFDGDIHIRLQDPPKGISGSTARLRHGQEMVRMAIRSQLTRLDRPVPLTIVGQAQVGDRELVRTARAAEDRMQAFLWRHLVPVDQFTVRVFNPSNRPPGRRAITPIPEEVLQAAAAAQKERQEAGQQVFTKQQVARRLRELNYLYENYLLTEDFYHRKAAECEVAPDDA